MANEEYSKARRNLMALSFFMIVVYLAGGDFSQISLLGASFSPERPYVVQGSIWALFCWSLWQHQLYGKSFEHTFEWARRKRLFDQFAKGRILKVAEEDGLKGADLDFDDRIELEFRRGVVRMTSPRRLARVRDSDDAIVESIDVPTGEFARAYVEHNWWIIWNSDEFSKVVVPKILAAFALIVGQLSLFGMI